MSMAWSDSSGSEMSVPPKRQRYLERNQVLLQKLYCVLGAGAVLALFTICGELFSSSPMCSCCQNIWVVALLTSAHAAVQSSVIHFGQQLFDIGFGPIFLFRGLIMFSAALGIAKCGKTRFTLWPDDRREQR